jgi:hypothetical protein
LWRLLVFRRAAKGLEGLEQRLHYRGSNGVGLGVLDGSFVTKWLFLVVVVI